MSSHISPGCSHPAALPRDPTRRAGGRWPAPPKPTPASAASRSPRRVAVARAARCRAQRGFRPELDPLLSTRYQLLELIEPIENHS